MEGINASSGSDVEFHTYLQIPLRHPYPNLGQTSPREAKKYSKVDYFVSG